MIIQDLERSLAYAKKIRTEVDAAIAGIEYLIGRERGKSGLTSLESVELFPKRDGGKSNGANGMKPGDRVQYTIDGRTGIAKEFLQDGDATVIFDDGKVQEVKWNHLRKLEPGEPRKEDTFGGLRPSLNPVHKCHKCGGTIDRRRDEWVENYRLLNEMYFHFWCRPQAEEAKLK